MVTTVLNKLRTFNPRTIVVAPFDVRFSGFEGNSEGRLAPFAAATKIIARDGVTGIDDVAARGDVRVISRNPLNQGQLTAINQILDNHNDTVDSPRQARRRSLDADADALKVTHDAGIADLTMARMVRLILNEAGIDV